MPDKKQVIISLTSFPEAIPFAVQAIQSILMGSVLPDKIVLYLTYSQFGENGIPEELQNLADSNSIFEIRNYDDDIRSYRKLVPGLVDFPDAVIITIDDDVFENDVDGSIQFFARYLNTISLGEDSIKAWIKNGATEESYPVHQATICKGWYNHILSNGAKINLFPFTEHAILALIREQKPSERKPRSLIRNIMEPYILEGFGDLKNFPQEAPTVGDETKTLRENIYEREGVEENAKIRLFRFMSVWGDGTQDVCVENGIKYIGGIQESIYSELGLPIAEGKLIKKTARTASIDPIPEDYKENRTSKTPEKIVDKKVLKAQENVSKALHEVDKWIEHEEYKLNIGQTTKNDNELNAGRTNINENLFNVIGS